LENEPQNLEGEPQNEPQNLENEPQNLESEPQNLESEPQNFGNKPQNTYEDLNKTTAQVLNVIKENNIATKEDIALQLNKSVSTVKRCISILRDNGYIEYVGVSKNGSWKILK
jgi:predicted HTH transcriptional regulator